MIRYLVGDVFDRMSELEDGSVDLILTSPPFLALRSYLPADHPLKDKEIGSESTPAEFIDTLLLLTAEWRRLLAPHGSLVVELGDTYAGSGGDKTHRYQGISDPSAARPTSFDAFTITVPVMRGPGWPLAKSLTLVPESYRFALAYGFNPHTGKESPAGTWRIRNVIRWVRPNPPVGALGDKFRPATSELVVACVSDRRWFDLDAVREVNHADRMGEPSMANTKSQAAPLSNLASAAGSGRWHPNGAPPLDWWKLSPGGYSGAHYAVWPPDLCVKPIKSMCPREVCRECGQPRRRIVEQTPEYAAQRAEMNATHGSWTEPGTGRLTGKGVQPLGHIDTRQVETVGWSDCGHGNYRPGLVLDPFAGTGTTLMVAHGHGRDAIGIDLDERNADLARDRVGPMFLEVG